MSLYKNHGPVRLTMQFGTDDPVVIEPGGVGEVPDQWDPWVVARGYKVERVEEDAFVGFVDMAKDLARPLVNEKIESAEVGVPTLFAELGLEVAVAPPVAIEAAPAEPEPPVVEVTGHGPAESLAARIASKPPRVRRVR